MLIIFHCTEQPPQWKIIHSPNANNAEVEKPQIKIICWGFNVFSFNFKLLYCTQRAEGWIFGGFHEGWVLYSLSTTMLYRILCSMQERVTGALWKPAPSNSSTTSLEIKAGLFRVALSAFPDVWGSFFAVDYSHTAVLSQGSQFWTIRSHRLCMNEHGVSWRWQASLICVCPFCPQLHTVSPDGCGCRNLGKRGGFS